MCFIVLKNAKKKVANTDLIVFKITAWKYIREIDPPNQIKELTLQEIADKFNMNVKNLKIVEK